MGGDNEGTGQGTDEPVGVLLKGESRKTTWGCKGKETRIRKVGKKEGMKGGRKMEEATDGGRQGGRKGGRRSEG